VAGQEWEMPHLLIVRKLDELEQVICTSTRISLVTCSYELSNGKNFHFLVRAFEKIVFNDMV
jgi:hypothetical protein